MLKVLALYLLEQNKEDSFLHSHPTSDCDVPERPHPWFLRQSPVWPWTKGTFPRAPSVPSPGIGKTIFPRFITLYYCNFLVLEPFVQLHKAFFWILNDCLLLSVFHFQERWARRPGGRTRAGLTPSQGSSGAWVSMNRQVKLPLVPWRKLMTELVKFETPAGTQWSGFLATGPVSLINAPRKNVI